MKHDSDIQELLKRYWEGETTLEEERRLKAYFTAGEVPEQYQPETGFFQALREEQAVQLPGRHLAAMPKKSIWWYGAAAALVLLFSAGIWWWHVATQSAPTPSNITANTPPKTPVPADSFTVTEKLTVPAPKAAPVKLRPRLHKHRKAAPRVQPSPPDSYDDPEQALAEIKAALELVSSKINKGRRMLDKGLHEVDNIEILLKKKNETSG